MPAATTTAEMGLMNITRQPRVYFDDRDPVREALQALFCNASTGTVLLAPTAAPGLGLRRPTTRSASCRRASAPT